MRHLASRSPLQGPSMAAVWKSLRGPMLVSNFKTFDTLTSELENFVLRVKTRWNHTILYLKASQTTCLPSSIEKIRAVDSGWLRHQVALLSFWMSWTSQGPVRPQNCTRHYGVGAPATNEPKVALTLPSKLVQMRAIEIQLRKHAASFMSQCVVLFAIPASQILEICW